MNILYDRDHYKLALGQMSSVKHMIDNVGKEYLKLLKFGDSLYRCKALKRAALGRMATLMKRQKESMAYLEQVRQHMARLPSIDPSGRTLLLCGYPNVGKSSFMNCVTRAEVDVQPYAFTTKSLFVGHMDYKYLRWQVIDTPGLLDHPLEERNTIEMQSITALAHIRASVLYFVDLSGQCGYTLTQQLSLFASLKPLFIGKPVLLVTTKSDILKPEDLPLEEQGVLSDFLKTHSLPPLLSLSALQEDGVMHVRNIACDLLLDMRVSHKLTNAGSSTMSTGGGSVLSRLHQAVPQPRDDKVRGPHIPEAVHLKVSNAMDVTGTSMDTSMDGMTMDTDILRHETDFNYGLQDRKHYLLKDVSWSSDIIPEILSGKNIADFMDVDIEAKLALLEAEEEEFEERGHYQPLQRDANLVELKKTVDGQRTLMTNRKRAEKGHVGKAVETMKKKRAALLSKRKKFAGPEFDGHEDDEKDEENFVDVNRGSVLRTKHSERSRSRIASRSLKGFPQSSNTALIPTAAAHGEVLSGKSTQLALLAQKRRNMYGKAGEADRHHTDALPKHLFSGKRKNGTHDRR